MTERFAGEGAQAYDERIPLLVPGYELLHQLSAAQLMTRLGPGVRVLLVGVGTGSELVLLGRLCPGWQFVAQDISADMLALARHRADEAGMGGADQLAAGRLARCLVAMRRRTLSAGAAFFGERHQGGVACRHLPPTQCGVPATAGGSDGATRFGRAGRDGAASPAGGSARASQRAHGAAARTGLYAAG